MLAAIVLNIDPILVQLGPLAIRWYGLMYVIGIIVGVQVALPYALSLGITEDQVWSMIGPCIVTGLLGGRLFYVVQQPLGPFIAQPWRIIATWEGGMAFYGAIGAVFLTLLYMCHREKISFWRMLDATAVFAAVGQTFGRIGNIINGDILGAPTNLPWGVIYVNGNSFAPSHAIAYQPAAAYELFCDLILIAILFTLRYRMKKSGLLATVYFIGYAVTQFLVFFLRDSEPIVGFGLKQAQLTSLVVFVIALGIGAYRLRSDEPLLEPESSPTVSTLNDGAQSSMSS
ncbi:MAG TPA: prolipoprotein diacylglyceryl transferase [Chloroflexota bacterium]|nr:prolipoprotein diacylglyceryl transferase [Chloroflexota bacterium]